MGENAAMNSRSSSQPRASLVGQPALLAGLRAPEDRSTPAERRAWLRELSNDDLARHVVGMALQNRRVVALNASRWAQHVGVPAGELVASPFTARACALGTALGVVAVHHELRAPLTRPAVAGAVRSGVHGEWVGGAFEVGKYESFFQDEPLIAFNPNHSARWTAHEMLHRAAGYLWRRDLSAFELYLGARLNELVPVVHWYGPDLLARLDESGPFDRTSDASRPSAELADAAWLTESEAALTERVRAGLVHLRHGLDRFEAEWSAIDAEWRTGRQHVVRMPPYPTLDGSSDALAYVVGHRTRLQTTGARWLHERVLAEGAHYESTVPAARRRVEEVFDRLFFGDVVLDWEAIARCADQRHLWDALHRAVSCGDGEHKGGRLRRHAVAFRRALAAGPSDWAGQPGSVEPSDIARLIRLAYGRRSSPARLSGARPMAAFRAPAGAPCDPLALPLAEGIRTLSPLAWDFVPAAAARRRLLREWAGSDALWSRAPLAERFARLPWPHPAIAALARLEAIVHTLTGRDPYAECLQSAAEDGAAAGRRWIAHTGFRRLDLNWDVVALYGSLLLRSAAPDTDIAPPEERSVSLLIGRTTERVHLAEVPSAVADWWTSLRNAASGEVMTERQARSALAAEPGAWEALVELGAVVAVSG